MRPTSDGQAKGQGCGDPPAGQGGEVVMGAAVCAPLNDTFACDDALHVFERGKDGVFSDWIFS